MGRLSGWWPGSGETFIAGNPFRSPTQIDGLYFEAIVNTDGAGFGMQRQTNPVCIYTVYALILRDLTVMLSSH